MILPSDIEGIKLNNITLLFNSILAFRRIPGNDNMQLELFKSDISEAYCHLPLHELFKIKQILTIDSHRHVDHNLTFGSRGSPRIWASFMGLVISIAIFFRKITALLAYMDDSYSFECAGDEAQCWLGSIFAI
jgi:hypothetical protein